MMLKFYNLFFAELRIRRLIELPLSLDCNSKHKSCGVLCVRVQMMCRHICFCIAVCVAIQQRRTEKVKID